MQTERTTFKYKGGSVTIIHQKDKVITVTVLLDHCYIQYGPTLALESIYPATGEVIYNYDLIIAETLAKKGEQELYEKCKRQNST